MAKPSTKTKALEVEVLPDSTALSLGNSEVAQINALHKRATAVAEEAEAKRSEAGHLAFLTGLRLTEYKASLAHGQWGKLFTGRKNANSAQTGKCAEFDFSQDTATRWMGIAAGVIETHGLTDKDVKKITALAKTGEITPKARTLINKLTDGRGIRQLYQDYGMISTGSAPALDVSATVADKRGGPGGTRAATAASVEAEQKKAREQAHKDALELAGMLDAFTTGKSVGLLDETHLTALRDAATTAANKLKKIKA